MRFVCLLFMLMVTTFSFAGVCPDLHDQSKKLPAGWQAFDSITKKPMTRLALVKFRHHANQFAMAKASGHAIYCYYSDIHGSNLYAYLYLPNVLPSKAKAHYWYEVTGAKQCAAPRERCEHELG